MGEWFFLLLMYTYCTILYWAIVYTVIRAIMKSPVAWLSVVRYHIMKCINLYNLQYLRIMTLHVLVYLRFGILEMGPSNTKELIGRDSLRNRTVYRLKPFRISISRNSVFRYWTPQEVYLYDFKHFPRK